MNRGSLTLSDIVPPPKRSFNEAPIHESGKSSMLARGCTRATRFNEAPIHESGK